MNRSFMMDKKATFEEKYGVYNNVEQQQGTDVEFTGILEQEDDIVPPSLEDDPNQASPLPPDVHNASEEDDLDAFIKNAEEAAKQPEPQELEVPVIQQQSAELGGATLTIIEENLKQYTVKQLKEEYKNRGGTRNVDYNNNKKNLINLILELVINGAPQEEGTAAGQDGSAD